MSMLRRERRRPNASFSYDTMGNLVSHNLHTGASASATIFPRDLHIKVKHFSEYISLMIFQRLRRPLGSSAHFFSGPLHFTWEETRKASVRAKSKSVDEGCLLLRLSPLVIDVSPVLLPRHCQTGSIVCVCAQVIVVSSDPISPFFIQLLHWVSHLMTHFLISW